MDNLRKHVRYRCEHPLWVRPFRKRDAEFQLVEVQNISAGGAYFLSGDQLKLNQILELTIEFPKHHAMVTLRGPVRHIRRKGPYYLCGLAFDHILDLKPQQFSHYIEAHFAAERTTAHVSSRGRTQSMLAS